jgi:hypothetical protein
VIFQSDPFAVPRRKPVTFARESQTIAEEPQYNGRWLCEIYGEKLVQEISNNPVCCAGTTIGTQEGILRYLDLMCDELLSRPINRAVNYDQGIHNYIAWKLRPDFIEVDLSDEVMCTVGVIKPENFDYSDGKIEVNGIVTPIIHQWDRSPALSAYVCKQIETVATAFVTAASQKPEAFVLVPNLDLELDPHGRSLSPNEEGHRFFRAILHPEKTLHSVISFYINFHGSINWGQQNVVVEQIKKLIGDEATSFTRNDILGESGELTPAFLERFAPNLASAYFVPIDTATEIEILRPSTENDWRDDGFPLGLGQRLRRADRPAFSLLSITNFDVFASTYGYQLFDAKRGVYLPIGSSRAFSRSVQFYPRREVSAPLVIVQDEYDGGNFAHFLFDWLPRILHFAERHPELARKAIYLMGGAQGELHDLAIARLCEKRGLDRRQFLFPLAREVIIPSGRIYFFSDQKNIVHPLHMGDPETVHLVRELFEDCIAPESGTPERIYISRRDATMRRVVNEADLVARLRERGYTDICLSELSLLEQIGVVGGAQSIVAPHGMGLAHIIFNRGSGELLELFNPAVGTDAYAFAAKALGLRYGYVLGRETGDGYAGFTVDISEVIARLDDRSFGATLPIADLKPLSFEERTSVFETLATSRYPKNLPRRLLIVGIDNFVAMSELEAGLATLGFASVNFVTTSAESRMDLFAGAEALVLLGDIALPALRYCAPRTPIVIVTAPGTEPPKEYLDSLELNYSVLSGEPVPGGWAAVAEGVLQAVVRCVSPTYADTQSFISLEAQSETPP